jgi:hypothetical protein
VGDKSQPVDLATGWQVVSLGITCTGREPLAWTLPPPIWWPHADALAHPTVGLIDPFPFRRTSARSEQGFALFSGPGISRADLGEHRFLDLPATILVLLGYKSCCHEGHSNCRLAEAR